MKVEEKAREYAVNKFWGVCELPEFDYSLIDNAEEDFTAGYNETKKETNTWVEVYDAPLSSGTFPERFEPIYGINMPYEQRYACYYDGDNFISEEAGYIVDITHWIYVPEAPKE